MVKTLTQDLTDGELEAPVDGKQGIENEVEQVWGAGTSKYILDIDKVPKPDWLVEGIIVRQGLTLIYGESKVGKTTFCLYLIDALQTGKPFFSRKCKGGKVLIAEQDQSPPLLRAQKDKLGIPKKLWVVKVPLRWDNKGYVFNADLEGLLCTCHPDVLIIDAYTSLGVADITLPSAGLTFDELRVKSQQYNCAFVLIHHTNLGGHQMGSNLNVAKTDSIIVLQKDTRVNETTVGGVTAIVAKQEKIKADDCDDIKLNFNTKTLEMTQVNTKSCRQQVLQYKQEGKTVEEIIELLPDEKPDTIRRYCRESGGT